MEGHHLTFFMQHDQLHKGAPVAEWLMRELQAQGITGATLVKAGEGFGYAGRLFAARFSGLPSGALEITMAVTVAELQEVLARLRKENVRVFYTFVQVDFGMSSGP